MTTVLRVDNQYLVLEFVKRNHGGQITEGYVVNGSWKMMIKDKQVLVIERSTGHIKNQWTPVLSKEIQVENTDDYNLAINRAQAIEGTDE